MQGRKTTRFNEIHKKTTPKANAVFHEKPSFSYLKSSIIPIKTAKNKARKSKPVFI